MYLECRHIMPSGAKCHSPAMRGTAYCFFHAPGRRNAQGQRRAHKKSLKLPGLVDCEAVNIALVQVLNAIASSKLDPGNAGQLLFGLRIASDNLQTTRRLKAGSKKPELIANS